MAAGGRRRRHLPAGDQVRHQGPASRDQEAGEVQVVLERGEEQEGVQRGGGPVQGRAHRVQRRDRQEGARGGGENADPGVRKVLPGQLVRAQLAAGPGEAGLPAAVGQGHAGVHPGFGREEAGGAVRRPERLAPGNRPGQPEVEPEERGLHAAGKGRDDGDAGNGVRRLVPAPVPGGDGRVHLVEQHAQLEGEEHRLAAGLLHREREDEGGNLRQRDP